MSLEPISQRVTVRGKFLFAADARFFIKGVTYGPFRPEPDGSEYHTPELVRRDFALMSRSGFNAVRVYTVPPRWLLDIAGEMGLRVLMGLPWEQHVAFLDDRKRPADIERRVREGVRAVAGHPALLAITVGNEIPAPIVRWHGHRKIERFIRRLYNAVKQEDPTALVTYVNYPSTEYLHLPFLDFVCFNVYLENEERLSAYLARLQNIAGEKPLVMAEIGLDSLRNGDAKQASTLDWQIRGVFSAGCSGTFVFAWTDEWFRGGHDILDWKFGLTTVARDPKPALETVRQAMMDTPFSPHRQWPRMSVVVCTHNGARTIRDTLEGLKKLQYPDAQLIVVDDGSIDETAKIVGEYIPQGVRLVTTSHAGLGAARNAGLQAADGEIVAYLDDDAWPDPHWLMYLADGFMRSGHAGIGGPNIAPPDQGLVAQCVAQSPGGPTHVLITDQLAEHIPGCNMAFRTACLREIGGFDEQFRIAGDDVDVCWRIQERGWTLGFVAAAMVWHYRREEVGRYWKQQYHYGAAEGQLERKWPERYTASGRIQWSGRLYDRCASWIFGHSRRRIYHGTWGSALFQSVYEVGAGSWSMVPLMPEWFMLIGVLGLASLAGIAWKPMLLAIPLLVLAGGASVLHAVRAGRRAALWEGAQGGGHRLKARLLIAWLHLIQPLGRLLGRLRFGMTPWRRRGLRGWTWPCGRTCSVWSETWLSPESRLETLETKLRSRGAAVMRGGDYDAWDLEVRGGILGGARLRLTFEEHGSGKQMSRYRIWPRWSWGALSAAAVAGIGAVGAGVTGSVAGAVVLGAAGAAMLIRTVIECGSAVATLLKAEKT